MAGPIARLMARRRERAVARNLASKVLSAARRPDLYLSGWSEDTFEGRLGQFALHGALVLRRLKAVGPSARGLAERLGEAFAETIDVAYREEGVGDAAIARKVRASTSELYGLARALDAALASGEPEVVEEVLSRNGLGGGDIGGLARHMLATDDALGRVADADIASGRFDWPALSK